MREWKRTNVKALTIINHQKALPALDRENNVFRELVVETAEKQHLGLITTFELYRLLRSFLKHEWKHENIKDIFLQSGRLSIVPSHYRYVGEIENYWEKVEVVGIRIKENAIHGGDKLAFELPIEFEEITVKSLEVENTSVEAAEAGALAGIKTSLTKQVLKKGVKVYRISSTTSES